MLDLYSLVLGIMAVAIGLMFLPVLVLILLLVAIWVVITLGTEDNLPE